MRSDSTTKKSTSTIDRAIDTEQKIRNIVSRLLVNDDDNQAQALIALCQMIAYEKEFTARDSMAFAVRSAAFTYTMAFSRASESFALKAGVDALTR